MPPLRAITVPLLDTLFKLLRNIFKLLEQFVVRIKLIFFGSRDRVTPVHAGKPSSEPKTNIRHHYVISRHLDATTRTTFRFRRISAKLLAVDC